MKTCESCSHYVLIVGGDVIVHFCKEMCIEVKKSDGRFCYYREEKDEEKEEEKKE